MVSKDQKLNTNLKKLVSNAKAIVTNQIAMPLGVRKMNKIIIWLSQGQYACPIDMTVFQNFENNINGCPVGTERLLWDKEALKLQDQIIDEALAIYKHTIMDKCFEIIESYDKEQ
jgi:hypothetical protein